MPTRSRETREHIELSSSSRMCNPSSTSTTTKSSIKSSNTNSKVDDNVGMPTEVASNTGKALDRMFTLKELASKYNKPQKAYASVHGTVIDVTAFAKNHPGGDVILLSAGRDATILFETYHPRLQNGVPKAIVQRYAVGRLSGGEEVMKESSYYDWSSLFYPTLKHRVCERLQALRRTRRGGLEILLKACFLLIGFWFSLLQMITSPFSQACLWSSLMGIFASFVGTCIQHDGNHGAFSTNKLLNKAAGWTLDMIGASAYTWEFQHMLGHHPYTNLLQDTIGSDQESDPDVFSSYPLLRMHPAQGSIPLHRFQHYYAPLLFALMTLSKVFQQDYDVVWTNKLYHIDASCRYASLWNRLRFYLMKAITTFYMIILPCYFHGWVRGLFLFALGHLVCGEMLATMFIVNHVIEGVAFAEKKKGETGEALAPRTAKGFAPMLDIQNSHVNGKAKAIVPLNDWAAVQCQTSVNWSSGSWFWNHFSGGLNHQIEHHLFPSICHSNYPYIQDVVESTCVEFGVPYRSEKNLWTAYGKMINHLKYLGTLHTTVVTKKEH